MYTRKTVDVYYIMSKYGKECSCSSLSEAKENLKDYRSNVDYPVWIEIHRERINK